jgi:hypothetical protein
MKSLRNSCIVQIILTIYFQVINWFSLGSWNNQDKFQPVSSQMLEGKLGVMDWGFLFTFILPLIIFSLGMKFRKMWLIASSLLLYVAWLFLQIYSWWIPYIFGANENWTEIYHRVFAKTTKLLPSFGNHLAPDAMHFTLQVLLVVVVVLTVRGMFTKGVFKKEGLG